MQIVALGQTRLPTLNPHPLKIRCRVIAKNFLEKQKKKSKGKENENEKENGGENATNGKPNLICFRSFCAHNFLPFRLPFFFLFSSFLLFFFIFVVV